MSQTIEQARTGVNKGRWKPGQSGNPGGRPAIPEKRHLENALRDVARQKHGGKDFLHHIAEQAFEDKSVALAVLDKLVPNNQMPKEKDESNGIKQIIIIRPERGTEEAKVIPRSVRVQPEDVPCDVVELGHRKDNVVDIAGNAIQRADREQPGSDLP